MDAKARCGGGARGYGAELTSVGALTALPPPMFILVVVSTLHLAFTRSEVDPLASNLAYNIHFKLLSDLYGKVDLGR